MCEQFALNCLRSTVCPRLTQKGVKTAQEKLQAENSALKLIVAQLLSTAASAGTGGVGGSVGVIVDKTAQRESIKEREL